MSQATVIAPADLAPARPGTLGLPPDARVPADASILPPAPSFYRRHLDAARRDVRELALKTGRVLEVEEHCDGGYVVVDEVTGETIATGETAGDAVANAEVVL